MLDLESWLSPPPPHLVLVSSRQKYLQLSVTELTHCMFQSCCVLRRRVLKPMVAFSSFNYFFVQATTRIFSTSSSTPGIGRLFRVSVFSFKRKHHFFPPLKISISVLQSGCNVLSLLSSGKIPATAGSEGKHDILFSSSTTC